MRNETGFTIDYFQSHSKFLDAIKVLSPYEKIQFMKKNLDLDEYTDLTQVQCNLFYVAIGNMEWDIVIQELDGDGGIDSNDGN